MTRRFTYTLKALSLALLSFAAAGCEEEDNENLQGNWVNTYTYFPGTPRGGAVCFQLEYNGELVAFVGTGANTKKTEDMERYRDFYMASINPKDGTPQWTERYAKIANKTESSYNDIDGTNPDNIPADRAVCSMPNTFHYENNDTTTKVFDCPARNGAVAFSLKIGDKPYGFVGLGYDGTNYLKDFWRYDPESNTWERVADYMGDAVRYATAFVIDNKAYVGGGEDFDNNILGDFYCYDAASNTWTSIQSCNVPRAQSTSFVCTVGGKEYGYLHGGTNGGNLDVLERYDPENNVWINLRRLSDASRDTYDDQYVGLATYGSTSFVIKDELNGDRAFVTTGGTSSAGQLTWEYNPYYDYWVQKTSFEGNPRKFAVSFVLEHDYDGNGKQQVAFVTTGSTTDMTVTGSSGTFYADCWGWEPQAPYEYRD